MTTKRIHKLNEQTINRIAAGEIIHRPSNAIKELLENSLDAQATLIQITCKEGGMKSFTITDNGCGIHKDDLSIVAERFTTSKLSHFSDLQTIQTFGFRGEAISSITHVAHLTLTTKTIDSPCAYRAQYSNGKLLTKNGKVMEPKPTAGNVGTVIQVEDLFYNIPTRKKAFKNTAEEYNKILEVVQKYAILNYTVGFVCKKQGSNQPDLQTVASSSPLDIIRMIYGTSVSKELLDFQAENEQWEFSCSGYISNANFNSKRKEFILFINHRLVECTGLKKSVDAVYAKYLPKGTFSFSYLDLKIKPENVDVNVHPTKKTVHFLNQDKIVEMICSAIDERMKRADESRTFFIQTKIGTPMGLSQYQGTKSTPKKTPSHLLVRTDSRARTLDSFMSPEGPLVKKPKQSLLDSHIVDLSVNPANHSSHASQEMPLDFQPVSPPFISPTASTKSVGRTPTFPPNRGEPKHDPKPDRSNLDQSVVILDDTNESDQPCVVFDGDQIPDNEPPHESQPIRDWNDIQLLSIKELRQAILNNEHHGISDLFKNHSFVGCYNEELALVQHQTDLILVHFYEISAAFFYQAVLYGFSNFGVVHIDPIPIHELVMIGIDQSGAWNDNMLPKPEIATQITDLLEEKKYMLAEYFCILVSDGRLSGLPMLINGYVPNMNRVGLFLLGLGNHVDWTSEKPCFHDIATELSEFYATRIENDSIQQQVEHLVFPALRTVIGQQDWIERDYIRKVANLADLYKIFERC